MLKTKLKDELILSMKEKNQLRVSTLRMINASIKDLEISQRINKQTEDASDNDIIGWTGSGRHIYCVRKLLSLCQLNH